MDAHLYRINIYHGALTYIKGLFREATRGINAVGLAFTSAMVIDDDKLRRPATATPFADITELIMKDCETVADAIDVFSSKKAIRPAYSVLLGDAKGDLAHIEVGSYGMAIYSRYSIHNPGTVFAVNCYLSQAFIHYNAPHTLITNKDNNNLARRERGRALAEQFRGELDVNILMKILSDHKNNERDPTNNPILEAWGYSICNHGTRKKETYSHENLPWGTVSAEILQPSKRQFWYAYGWPCGQAPEYGDQIFQENSWGKFVAFGLKGESHNKEVTFLTTPGGEITPEGSTYLLNPLKIQT